MRREELFDAWAPEGAPWSDWVRPVLFASAGHAEMSWSAAGAEPAAAPPVIGFAPQSPAGTAVVVDVAGPDAVAIGAALAARGWQPVPLFNGAAGKGAIVDVAPIVQALAHHADAVRAIPWSAGDPPAFLLDARRKGPGVAPKPGEFDNRWVALPQDFPSGALLRSRGIREAVVLAAGATGAHATAEPADDLAHVLRRWQDAGIAIRAARWGEADRPAQPVVVRKPAWFASILYLVGALAGLRRADAGGFGGIVPHPGSHG